MLEFIVDGLFTKDQVETLKEKLSGKTFFNFQISYSNNAGNYTIIVRSETKGYTPKEMKDMFYYYTLSALAND